MTDAPRISWKVKAVGGLMGLGLALRWLAGQRTELMDQALSEMLLAFDWLILTALFCAVVFLPVRSLFRYMARRRNRSGECPP